MTNTSRQLESANAAHDVTHDGRNEPHHSETDAAGACRTDASRTHGPVDDTDVPSLDEKAQGVIGRALQAHFDDLLSAPLPDRFLVLLAELEAREAQAGQTAGHMSGGAA